jgi:bifunctional DNA-binding transcriptional regulator/antitoxin component of YhaV-PrlF toxin-antitoxin module
MQKKFKVVLAGDPEGKMECASITLPFDTREVWGKARVPVKVTINGYSWRSTVANMRGCQFVVVNATARKGAGVKAGDEVTVTMEPDTEKRTIELPAELRKGLGAKLATKLEALAYTHQKEYVRWYEEAKKEETRLRRVEKMKEMLSKGETIS